MNDIATRQYLIRCSYFMRGTRADIASIMRRMGFIRVTPEEIERVWQERILADDPLYCQARPDDGFPSGQNAETALYIAIKTQRVAA